MFIGRTHELALLNQHYQSSCGELFILYGRRRVGKTELLNQFCKQKQSVYYIAIQTTLQDNLQQLVAECMAAFPDEIPNGVTFQSLEQVLSLLAKLSKHKRLILVLDEFQYWVQSDNAIPSQIQRFWDTQGKKSNLMLVLCGSYISLMIEHTLAEKSPLYGRRTGQLQLHPFDYRTAALFFKKWNTKEKLMAYGVLGGIPAYLRQFDDTLTFEQNIIDKILTSGRFLGEEANFLLKMELRDTRIYANLLKLIASGNTALKELASKTNLDGRHVSAYLSNLQGLRLVRREVSFVDKAPEKSRKGLYLMEDHFLNFWFQFAASHTTLIERNMGKLLYDQLILPHFSTYMGKIFEGICAQYLQWYSAENKLPVPVRVGCIWDKDYDIDVVCDNVDGSVTFGECKWSTRALRTHQLLSVLQERAAQTKLSLKEAHFVLFMLKQDTTFKSQDKHIHQIGVEALL